MSHAPSQARFETTLGTCGIAWSALGVIRVHLPGDPPIEGLPDLPAVPPPFVAAAVSGIRRLLAGEPVDLSAIAVDLAGQPPFTRRVLQATRAIPPGRIETYGALAALVGRPGAARAVGQAMARNPVPLLVPCHRVVGAWGCMVGFSAPGGTATKQRLLALESGAVKP